MTQLVQIQTYATCNQENFSAVLQRYGAVLEKLGCMDPEVVQWINALSWPGNEDDSFGDIYASPILFAPKGVEPLECSSLDVSIYTNLAIPTLEDPPIWIGFNIVFERDLLQEEEIAPYSTEVGKTLWHFLTTLGKELFELGVYLTNEWQDNQSWRSLVEEVGDPWNFEMAIFPRKLAPFFQNVPAGFQGTVVEGGFGFAQANRFITLPWT